MSSDTRTRGSEPLLHESCRNHSQGITRRRFVQGRTACGVIAGIDGWRWPAFANKSAATAPILSGNSFNLVIERIPVNYTGRRAYATAVNGSVPAPTLRWREGDTVTLAVTNRLTNHLDSLAWDPGSRRDGRRSRPEFSWNPAGRNLRLPFPSPPERHATGTTAIAASRNRPGIRRAGYRT